MHSISKTSISNITLDIVRPTLDIGVPRIQMIRRYRIWNPIHLVYGGMYWYVPVCTGMYVCIVHTSTYFSRILYNGTYQYVPVRTSTEKLPKVRTSTYFFVSVTVQGGTRRYKTVQEKIYRCIWRYIVRSIPVYGGTGRYKAIH